MLGQYKFAPIQDRIREIMQYAGVKQSRKTILMKVTSRQRPQILLETVRKYIEKAANTQDMVWLFSFDEDDEAYRKMEFSLALIDLIQPTGQGDKSLVVIGKSTGKIDAINRDVNNFPYAWDILLNISDDQRPIVTGYDDIIRRTMPDDLDASLWFNDGQPRINTQEIQGRAYYERFGWIYHPDFKSLFCDNLATDMAIRLGKCMRSSLQIIKHHHPAWGGTESFKSDDLYKRNDKFWEQDQATFERLQKLQIQEIIDLSKAAGPIGKG